MVKYLKPFFIFATVIMLIGVIYTVASTADSHINIGEKVLSAIVASAAVLGINMFIYKFLSIIWK